jgi:hypothetical protein
LVAIPARVPSGPDVKPEKEPGSYKSQLAVILDNLAQSTANGFLSFLPWQMAGAAIQSYELQQESHIRGEEKKGLKCGVREHHCVRADTARTA